MNNNKVSIIIPYYDSAIHLLRKCIDSCLTQTHENIEVILLIDGTPNDLSLFFRDYKDKDPRLEIVKSKHNHGVSYQRNKGIALAKGDYYIFVDSDDYIEKHAVELLVSSLQDNDADIAICSLFGSEYCVEDTLVDKKVFFSFPERFCKIQYTNFPVNKLFKASIIKHNSIRFNQNIELGEDAVFCQDYYKHVNYIKCLSTPLYHYIRTPGSATMTYNGLFFDYEKEVIKAILKNFSRYPLCLKQEKHLHEWLKLKEQNLICYYQNSPLGKKEKTSFLDAIKLFFAQQINR